MCGRELTYHLSDDARSGDHIWWISDVRKFKRDYPDLAYKYDLKTIIREIVAATQERMSAHSV
jgi:CDP-paratose 2-epimerase